MKMSDVTVKKKNQEGKGTKW